MAEPESEPHPRERSYPSTAGRAEQRSPSGLERRAKQPVQPNRQNGTASCIRRRPALAVSLIHRSAWKRNSRKFVVASAPPSSAASAPERHGATPSASKGDDLVAFVTPLCSKGWRLVTLQLPEKSCPIGPGLCRTSPKRRSRKITIEEVFKHHSFD